MTSIRRGWPPRHKRLRAVLEGAQAEAVQRAYPWLDTLNLLCKRLSAEEWARLAEFLGRNPMNERNVNDFARMCDHARRPEMTVDGMTKSKRRAFAKSVADAARTLSAALHSDAVQRSITFDYEPPGTSMMEVIVALEGLEHFAARWGERRSWFPRETSRYKFFAHSMRVQMQLQWRQVNWLLVHAAAVAVLHKRDVPAGIQPEHLPSHLADLSREDLHEPYSLG